MKKVFAMLLTLVMIVSFGTACGSDTQKKTAGKTVITITVPYPLLDFQAALEKAHPEIELQVEEMKTALIHGEIGRRLRKGNGPDLIITNLPAGEISEYTYDVSAEAFVENYQSEITKNIVVNGENHYLPLPGGYYGYFVNKTLLDELGLPLPETSQDLLHILAVAKEQNVGVLPETGYGFGLSDIGVTFLGAYFAADFATDFLSSADGVKWLASFEEKNATFVGNWEHSIDFVQTCIANGYMDPEKLIVYYNGRLDSNSNAFKAEEQMPQRTAILSYGNIAMYEKICDSTEDDIVMLPCLPQDASGNKLLSAVSNNFIAINQAIASDTTKLNAALTVLDYLSTPEGQAAWIQSTDCLHSYLKDYTVDASKLPESIRTYAENEMVFSNPFPTNLLSYVGKNLASAAKGKITLDEALAAIDNYNLNGSENVEYDLSVVGTIDVDMLYENSNTRKQETELGNFITDAIRETTGADVVLVNGGGIRTSLYQGDITGEDLSLVCPYGNLLIVAEMNGATLRAAITNGIQKTWKPAGQFLQVAGIRYAFKPAADETETAELVSLTYADGTEVKDEDVLTVAYTNYMGGASGYVDAGDGFTMLNVYDAGFPVQVKLIKETNQTYSDALKNYFANHQDETLTSKLEGRIEVIQ